MGPIWNFEIISDKYNVVTLSVKVKVKLTLFF
jgi:hypothetical protein